jgi:hypothetical protein
MSSGKDIRDHLKAKYPGYSDNRWSDIIDATLSTQQLLLREIRHAYRIQSSASFANNFRRFSHTVKNRTLIDETSSLAGDRIAGTLLGVAAPDSDDPASSDQSEAETVASSRGPEGQGQYQKGGDGQGGVVKVWRKKGDPVKGAGKRSKGSKGISTGPRK